MSFVLLGILNSQASGVAQTYFLSVLGGAGDDDGNSVITDSENNIYLLGSTDSTGAGGDDFLFVKYDSEAVVGFQRTLGGASREIGESVVTDSADNVYLFGRTNSEGAGGDDFLLAKYNSSGTIQWQRILGGAGTETSSSVTVDSADNIYILGRQDSIGSGGYDFLLAKYNSSGTIQWQRTLGGAENDFGNSVTIDSADNVYVTGFTASTGEGGADFLVAKYNSSGTIQWQRILGGAGSDNAFGVTTDSSNNVYILGQTTSTGAGGADFLLAKYDSSGTIQWQKELGGVGNEFPESVTADSSNNIYVFGSTQSTDAGNTDFLVAKYDSSGTIQWQRTLGGASNDFGNSVTIDSFNNLYLLGRTDSTGAGGDDFLLSKLPNDGSLEGTYSLDGNNIVYQASSLTAGTASLTSATSSLTSATSSLTSATSTLTSAAASLTVVTEEI